MLGCPACRFRDAETPAIGAPEIPRESGNARYFRPVIPSTGGSAMTGTTTSMRRNSPPAPSPRWSIRLRTCRTQRRSGRFDDPFGDRSSVRALIGSRAAGAPRGWPHTDRHDSALAVANRFDAPHGHARIKRHRPSVWRMLDDGGRANRTSRRRAPFPISKSGAITSTSPSVRDRHHLGVRYRTENDCRFGSERSARERSGG